MTFVTGEDLTAEIAKTLRGSKRDLAVAYWGKGASVALGLENANGIQIICDLWSGCCNPYELEALMEKGAAIWDCRNLHAKVYIGDDQVVTASANASINGLGKEGAENQLEAGYVSSDVKQLSVAQKWFNDLLEISEQVSDLAYLKSWWNERPAIQRPQPIRNVEMGLLRRAIANPSAFRSVGFAFSSVKSTAAEIRKAKKQTLSGSPQSDREIINWNPEFMMVNWKKKQIKTWPGEFFEYYFGPRGALYVSALRLYNRSVKAKTVFCKPDWESITPGITKIGRKNIAQADKQLAMDIITASDGGCVFQSAHELSEFVIKSGLDYS